MTARIARLLKRVDHHLAAARNRKRRIQPMSKQDQRDLDELNRRRAEHKRQCENGPQGPQGRPAARSRSAGADGPGGNSGEDAAADAAAQHQGLTQ